MFPTFFNIIILQNCDWLLASFTLISQRPIQSFLPPRFRVDTNGIHFLHGVINAVVRVQAQSANSFAFLSPMLNLFSLSLLCSITVLRTSTWWQWADCAKVNLQFESSPSWSSYAFQSYSYRQTAVCTGMTPSSASVRCSLIGRIIQIRAAHTLCFMGRAQFNFGYKYTQCMWDSDNIYII